MVFALFLFFFFCYNHSDATDGAKRFILGHTLLIHVCTPNEVYGSVNAKSLSIKA